MIKEVEVSIEKYGQLTVYSLTIFVVQSVAHYVHCRSTINNSFKSYNFMRLF